MDTDAGSATVGVIETMLRTAGVAGTAAEPTLPIVLFAFSCKLLMLVMLIPVKLPLLVAKTLSLSEIFRVERAPLPIKVSPTSRVLVSALLLTTASKTAVLLAAGGLPFSGNVSILVVSGRSD